MTFYLLFSIIILLFGGIIMNKKIFYLSILLILVSIGIHIHHSYSINNYSLQYRYINIKDVAMADLSEKNNKSNTNLLSMIDEWYLNEKEEIEDKISFTSVQFLKTKNSKVIEPPKIVWYLPVEKGIITQYPSYSHPAYDITSPRGTSEVIYPVANGVISSIYKDHAGGLTITINHTRLNEKYTSQYVHMWRYADGLYVGKEVSVNDALGWMGSTGYSTGTHLHIAVADCALYEEGGPCPDINSFSRYLKTRHSQGHRGLASFINIPYRWNGRNGS